MGKICPTYVSRRQRLRVCTAICSLIVLFTFVILVVRDTKQSVEVSSEIAAVLLKSKHKNQEEYIDKRGVHVVVGHYIGDDIPGQQKVNLTEEILNENGYDPRRGAGENGLAVQIPSFEIGRMQLLYNVNKFNLLASDRISLNRSLPDVRKKKCQEKKQLESLPSTSVIIVFHNEAWSTLLRTVHSVINRSDRKLIEEIILVDDASQRTFLKKPLEDYVEKLSVPVKVLRAGTRSGLIRARLLGAQEAKGEVLTFLDAHCEVSPGWLDPLLSEIAGDQTRVACPIIDIIDEDTFQYIRSFEVYWGAFNWNLHYRWFAMGKKEVDKRKHEASSPFKSPAMAGGLFSIDKNFFYKIGAYDSNMDIWGGENLEISFRVWMCGGSIVIVPCSHVGHVFRKQSPYTFPGEGGVGGVLYRNLARVALVWMDEWANFYFKMNPEAARVKDSVNPKNRLLLRKKLQCHDFEWYLSNVWEFNFYPSHGAFFGKIRNLSKGKCLERPAPRPGGTFYSGVSTLIDCVIETYAPQTFILTKKGFIMTDESVCLDSTDATIKSVNDHQVRFSICAEINRMRWTYDSKSMQLKHTDSGLCLDLPTKSFPDTLSVRPCSQNGWFNTQKWKLEMEDWTLIS